MPASVIVKWLRSHPQGPRTQLSQVHTERAALEFLTGLGVGLAPELLAADDAAGVLVLEDLPHSAPLYDLLARDDPLAATGLSAFAPTVAALRAATVGLENSYYERRRAFGPVDLVGERERFLGHGWRETPGVVEAMLGVPLGIDVERDIALCWPPSVIRARSSRSRTATPARTTSCSTASEGA